MNPMDADRTHWEKTSWELHKNATGYLEKNPGSNIPQNNSCMVTNLPSLKLSK